MGAALAALVVSCSAGSGKAGSSSCGSSMRTGIVSGRFSWHAAPARLTPMTDEDGACASGARPDHFFTAAGRGP